jgi:hypothetical protein
VASARQPLRHGDRFRQFTADEALVAAAVPFLRAGLAAGERVVLALDFRTVGVRMYE